MKYPYSNFLCMIISCGILLTAAACRPGMLMTSRPVLPSRPHAVLKNGDTVFASMLSLKRRFLGGPNIEADEMIIPHKKILYAYTSDQRKLIMTTISSNDQVITGKINVFGKSDRHIALDPPDSGYRVMVHSMNAWQKLPDPKLYGLVSWRLMGMVQDQPAAFRLARKAYDDRSWTTAAVAAGSVFGGTGLALLFMAVLDHKNPDNPKYEAVGLAGVCLGTGMLVIALPALKASERRHQLMAIDAYNNQPF